MVSGQCLNWDWLCLDDFLPDAIPDTGESADNSERSCCDDSEMLNHDFKIPGMLRPASNSKSSQSQHSQNGLIMLDPIDGDRGGGDTPEML